MKELMRKISVLLCLAMFLAGCTDRRGVVEIRVVATTDVHGCIFDKDILEASERKGSLAKVATLLKNERKANRNVIYLDAGDILQGSIEAYQDVTTQFYRPSLPGAAYKYLDCSAIALGNHDLSVGTLSYERFFDGLDCPVLGANVFFVRYGDYLPPYIIIENQGVRIAVLGLLTPMVSKSIPRNRLGELTVGDPVEAARYFVTRIREVEKADVLIGLIHSGLEGGRVYDDGVKENIIKEFVKEVPGFDLIMYGHDHTPYINVLASSDGDSVLVINPGAYANNAAVATLSVDFSEPDSPAVQVCGSIVDITGLTPDEGFMKAVSGWYDDVTAYSDSVIGRLSVPLECNGALWRPTSMLDYIHETQMGFFAAQISLAAPVSDVTYIPAGDFRIRDAFSLYKFDNTMVSVMLKGSEVKNVLEYSAERYYEDPDKNPGHLLKLITADDGTRYPTSDASGFISAAGINYTIDVTKPAGKRVNITSMSDGTPFDPDKSYRTTINSFLYTGAESALLKGSGISRSEILRRFNSSSEADIRYYMLTDLALLREDGKGLAPAGTYNWKLIPEKRVEELLAVDTIDFKLIK
ncbi:MAG: bifunctional metallophosphatase/5'-nucleotidase [Bacteroidaceae bacterium]